MSARARRPAVFGILRRSIEREIAQIRGVAGWHSTCTTAGLLSL